MVHKTDKIMEYVRDRDSDILFISETWLTSDINHVTALVKDYGYQLLHSRRKDRLKEGGGGVGILLKLNLNCKQLKCTTYSSFEYTMVKLFLEDKKDSNSSLYIQIIVHSNIYFSGRNCISSGSISHHL